MAVALEARRLVELRDRWLNPLEWVDWVDEPVPGYPKRPVPRDEDAAKALKKRTLTNLYNTRPQWLADAHVALDAAVAAAYGWSADITDDDALQTARPHARDQKSWDARLGGTKRDGCGTHPVQHDHPGLMASGNDSGIQCPERRIHTRLVPSDPNPARSSWRSRESDYRDGSRIVPEYPGSKLLIRRRRVELARPPIKTGGFLSEIGAALAGFHG